MSDNLVEIVPAHFGHDTEPGPPAELQCVGAVVQSADGPSFDRVSVLLEPGAEVRPGELLAVWHGRRGLPHTYTVIQVRQCVECNPNEDPDLAAARRRLGLGQGFAREGVSTRIYRLADCQTLEEVESSLGDGWKLLSTKTPELLCRSGDAIVILPAALAQAALGSLAELADGLHLGNLLSSAAINVVFSPEVLQLHMGIFGNPGKGKSYLAGVVVEELAGWQVPTLLLDVNGEMVDAVQSLGGKVIRLPNPAEFGLALGLISSSELISIAPNVRANTQYAELIEIAHHRLRWEGGNRAFTFDDLIAEINDQGTRLGITAASVRAAANRVTAMKTNKLIGAGFDFIEQLKKHKLICLDCRSLSLDQTRLVAAAAARELQSYGKKMANKVYEKTASADEARWFAVLFIDEAHAVAPEGGNSVSTQVLYELARMGRHARTGLVLASQSPADLDKSVLKRMQTRFVFALERDQLHAISGVAADLGDEIMAALPKLPRGTCAVSGTGDHVRHGFLLKVRPRRTPIGGATPKVFEGRVKRPVEEA